MEIKQVSSGGIVVRRYPEGLKILLIRDRFGYWTWPKGHLEQGEDLEQAAMREVGEETGIFDLEIIKEIGTQRYSFRAGKDAIFKTVHVFVMISKGEDKIKVQTEEISSASWFVPDQAIEMIGYEGSRDILLRAIDIMTMDKD